MQLKILFFFSSLGLSQKCNGIWALFSKTCNCPDDKAGRCGKRHNGRNVFHFSPVFPKMCWQPRMIFESLSKECFSSLIKGSFIRILFLIPRSKRGHALNILRSSAGLKWKCWSQHMCCYFFWLNNLKRKIKKSLLNLLKGSVLPGPRWPETPGWQWSGVLSPFWDSPHGPCQAHDFLTSAEAAVPAKPWHCLRYWESAGIQPCTDEHHKYPNISSNSWHLQTGEPLSVAALGRNKHRNTK